MLSKARLAVRQSLQKLEPGDRIVVAVSGGADSLLLAHCINLESKELALQIHVVIVNHQLQVDASDIALKTADIIRSFGITEITIIPVEVVKKDGLEADARRARYEALQGYATELGATAIFLGHNQDDLAEIGRAHV